MSKNRIIVASRLRPEEYRALRRLLKYRNQIRPRDVRQLTVSELIRSLIVVAEADLVNHLPPKP